jgi:hypothetical protein
MKLHRFFLPLLSLTYTVFLDAHNSVVTFFNNRSISRDAARDLAGQTQYINKDSDADSVYGALSVTPEYTNSFASKHMTKNLFGANLVNGSHLTISGSQVNQRGPQDLLADYFYLPTDFQSTVFFTPVIDNFIIDVGFYLGLDAWRKGTYWWIHAPLAHTRWDINIREQVINPGVNAYAAGYFTPTILPRGQLLENFTQFVNGVAIQNSDDISFQELKRANMSNERLIKTRLAEIRTGVGWNFYTEHDYHAGFNAQLAAPTGLRPKGLFLFEPIVGNAHHWELGVGANGHYTFWRNTEETAAWSVYLDANITHLFGTRQTRTFDLHNAGPLSRYMLAMEMTSPAVNLLGNGTAPSAQFYNDYLPVANFTTLKCDVSIAIQADIVLMLNYTHNHFSADIGYNYWGRTCEEINVRQVDALPDNTYALKGDAQIFGFEFGTATAVALSATESQATIHTGTNMPAIGSTNPAVITAAQHNPNIDLPQPATTNPGPPFPAPPPVNLQYAPNNSIPTDQINTSNPPIFIKQTDLNVNHAGSRGSSSKLFGDVSYTWDEKREWQPYISIGGSVEFAQHSNITCNTQKNNDCDCITASASQWGIWLKAGAAFD